VCCLQTLFLFGPSSFHVSHSSRCSLEAHETQVHKPVNTKSEIQASQYLQIHTLAFTPGMAMTHFNERSGGQDVNPHICPENTHHMTHTHTHIYCVCTQGLWRVISVQHAHTHTHTHTQRSYNMDSWTVITRAFLSIMMWMRVVLSLLIRV